MTMRKFKMMKAPIKPVRPLVERKILVYEGMSLAHILEEAKIIKDQYNIDLYELKASAAEESYDIDGFVYYILEPEEIFSNRIRDYNDELEKYNKWKEEFKEEIEADEQRKKRWEERKGAEAIKKMEKDIDKAIRELDKLKRG